MTQTTDIPLSQQTLTPGGIFDPRFTREMNIAERLHLTMTLVEYVQKQQPKRADQLGPGEKPMRYSIVTHDAVTALVRAALVKCGIVFTVESCNLSISGNMSIVNLVGRFTNIDRPDDFLLQASCGNGIDTGDKGPGKALSYAVKYAYLKALGLETGDDPDLDQDAVRANEPELRLESIIKRLKVEQDPDVVITALREGGIREAVAEVTQANGAHAPRLRAEVSAIAREHKFDMRTEWAS